MRYANKSGNREVVVEDGILRFISRGIYRTSMMNVPEGKVQGLIANWLLVPEKDLEQYRK